MKKIVRVICTLLPGFVGCVDYAYADPKLKHPTASKASAFINTTGTVQDAKGMPLVGVSVAIKGTSSGTVTDANGVFRLNLPTGEETLIFSSVGYKTQEVAVAKRTNFLVQMEDNDAALDEVVVVGYGTQKKVSLTGAVAPVDMKAIQQLPVGSLSAALQGQLPGVNVSGGTGRPGDNGGITVRNPIVLAKDGGTVRPLYVIDNVVRTEDDFNVLDASEVEAISVLKDAAAAIYGARSNQGVVVVATKRGKAGAPKVNYSGSIGITDAIRLPSMMNGYEQATYLNDYYRTQGKPANDPLYYTQDELDHFRNNNYNWLEMAWKPATLTRHAVNVSGGSERATYYAGVSYNYQNANFDNINANKWTFRASTDIKVTKNLRAGFILSGDLSQRRMYYLKQGGENPENDMRGLLYTSQFNPPYINGLPVLQPGGNQNNLESFHFFEIQRSNNYTATRNTGLNVMANLEYEVPFIKGLKARVLYSKTMDNSFGKQYGTRYNVYNFSMLGEHRHIVGGDVVGNPIPLKNGDQIRLNPGYTDSYQFNGYLNYDRQFGKHQVSAIAFFEQSERRTDMLAGLRENPIVGGLDNMRYATGAQTAEETETEAGTLSYAGRINYNYDDKYLAEVALRYDGSTNFAPEYRWGFFPSLSLGWVLSEEPFFKNGVSFVEFLKIRGSVGLSGGDATKPYNWLNSYSLQVGKGAVFGGNSDKPLGVLPNNIMANRGLQWDDNMKYNAGIDAQFFRNRLSFSLDGFYDHRYNMLTALSSSVPLTVGATLPSENFSIVNGFGFELSLGYSDKINKDWSYKINTFLAWSDNKRIRVDVERGKLGTYEDPIGRSTDMGLQGYVYEGMFRSQDEVDRYLEANPGYTIFGVVPKPGMLYYKDIRGPKDASGQFTAPDGKITKDVDMDYLTPKEDNHYNFGFNISTTYKSFTLAAVMGGSFGGQAIVEGSARSRARPTVNRPSFWTDHWTPENPNAAYPDPFYEDSYSVASAFWFRNAFTFAMRNLNINYSLPAPVAKNMGIGSMSVFLVAINPINFYNPYTYKTYQGAYDSYPTVRSFSLGLNVGF